MDDGCEEYIRQVSFKLPANGLARDRWRRTGIQVSFAAHIHGTSLFPIPR